MFESSCTLSVHVIDENISFRLDHHSFSDIVFCEVMPSSEHVSFSIHCFKVDPLHFILHIKTGFIFFKGVFDKE